MTKTVDKQAIIKSAQRSAEDTGSPEVQVSIMSERIKHLTDHLNTHKKDNHTRRGLLQLVGKRRRLLNYLKREDYQSYSSLIAKLGIRK